MDIEYVLALFFIVLLACIMGYWVLKLEASTDEHDYLEASEKNKQRLDEAINEVEEHNKP